MHWRRYFDWLLGPEDPGERLCREAALPIAYRKDDLRGVVYRDPVCGTRMVFIQTQSKGNGLYIFAYSGYTAPRDAFPAAIAMQFLERNPYLAGIFNWCAIESDSVVKPFVNHFAFTHHLNATIFKERLDAVVGEVQRFDSMLRMGGHL